MKSIFLSASIPYLQEGRDPEYYHTADVMAIRDAVLALVFVCLKLDIRIVWGGHPAITPIVYQAIKDYMAIEKEEEALLKEEEIKSRIQHHLHLFQSAYWKDNYPKDNNQFENVTITNAGDDRSSSLYIMRDMMISSEDFRAAVYIGGMEGIFDEDDIFMSKFPQAPTYPIASTGGAALKLYQEGITDRGYSSDLLNNYAYTSLFYSILSNL